MNYYIFYKGAYTGTNFASYKEAKKYKINIFLQYGLIVTIRKKITG